MYSEISFPGLGITLNPSRGIEIGPLSIHWYGVIIALGLCLAVVYALRRKEQFGLTEDDLIDGVLWVTPFAIVCARAYYCIFSWDQYASNPIRCLYIWEGGLAIYGGVIGAVIGVIVYCKIKKLKIGAVLDIVCLGFLIGQIVGRWGNFFNREAFGGPSDGFLRMGLLNTITGQVEYVHPTFLYESVWNLVGFIGMHFLSKHRKFDGQTALQYMAWYGLGRAFIEGMRTDSLYIGDSSLRVSQLLSILICAVGVLALYFLTNRYHDPAKLFVNIVAARNHPVEEPEATEERVLEECTVEVTEGAAEEAAEASEEAKPETPKAKGIKAKFLDWLHS